MEDMNSLSNFSKMHLFELVINQLEGFVISDEKGRYVFVSQRWSELVGLSLEDVKGLYIHDIVPESCVDEVLRTEKAISGELVKVRNTRGEELQLVCAYTPIFQEGKLIGCFTVTSLRGMDQVLSLSAKTEDLFSELIFYQKELAQVQGAKYSISSIAGNSPKIQKLKTDIHRVARSSSSVIIQGETGTGKELVAHSIHTLSTRSTRPFIKINCAAIPSDLLESELFGYAPGAFTGASKTGKKGKFQLADKGTLFLDEINQLPLFLQPKLLRALQEHEVEPVGSLKSIPVDCRIIAASNVPLDKLVRQGNFREDLYYRLNVILLEVPPLRERKEDIPLIADRLLERLNAQLGMAVPGISEEAKQKLKCPDWPGNVRELGNVIERAMNDAWLETLTWKHFEANCKRKAFPAHSIQESGCGATLPIRQRKDIVERQAILEALGAHGGNKSSASKSLGITRAMLYRKLIKYGLNADGGKES